MTGATARSPSSLARGLPYVIFATVFLLVAATSRDYGIVWDEPAYFHASDLHVQWLAGFSDAALHGRVGQSLDDKAIQAAWHWDPYHVPHPPFSRIVSGVMKAAFGQLFDHFVGYRLGPAVFFALLALVMYLWMTELFGLAAGLLSVAVLLTIPNLFAYAHFAVTDLPLASLWFTTAYCFWKGLRDWKWSVATGIVWGCALATKFPALLIFPPLIVWAQIYYRRSYVNNLFCMIFIAPVLMVVVQPYLWRQTGLRIIQFLYEGVSRGYRPDANFPIYFFHHPYYTNELPRYYPFFLTAVTTPETILALAFIGLLAAALRHRSERPLVNLFLINAVFVLGLGLLPGAVLHDGMRQLLSVYPFLIALAAAGFFFTVKFLAEKAERSQSFGQVKHFKGKLAGALGVVALVPALADVAAYHPFELSYYNRLLGGLSGAYDRGLETTYFMEAITPGFLVYLNRTLPPNATVNGFFSNFILEFYQKEGRLRRDIQLTQSEKYDYAVVLNRRASVIAVPRLRELLKQKPAAAVSLAGVPLVMLYKSPVTPP